MTYLTRFNKIAIESTAQVAADKEAFGLSRVHIGLCDSFTLRLDK